MKVSLLQFCKDLNSKEITLLIRYKGGPMLGRLFFYLPA